MARVEVKGIEDYQQALERLFADTKPIIKQAVYKGAKIVADEIKDGIQNIPIQEGDNGLPPMGTPENPLTGISRRQKADLLEGFGLAKMEDKNGYIETKAGMNGYGSVKTRAYPNGTPNSVLMRSIESGTSFRKKHPTFRPAVNRARKRAEQAMAEELENKIREKMEG